MKNWNVDEVIALFELPFAELMYRAQTVHRMYFADGSMQLSTLMNIKEGGCPEDCQYCPQAARYHTGVKAKKLIDVESVKKQAEAAKAAGATRFCMGGAWRELKDRDVPAIQQLIREVNELGLESCLTVGMLTGEQAHALKETGLHYYNHNIDTSPEFYSEIISTRQFDDRLQTLDHVRTAGIKVCCGGIIGMGESRRDRANFLLTLANMQPQIESVPINRLVKIPGTPLENQPEIESFEFVRTIAIARIMMPKARIRLAAGRTTMSDELHALCYMAGANSIFYGEKLLTSKNPEAQRDRELLQRLGMTVEELQREECRVD